MNQSLRTPSSGNLGRDRAASAVHAAPVQTLEQSSQLCGCEAHHTLLDPGPPEGALLEPLGHQAKACSVPPDQLDPVCALGAEHIDHAGISGRACGSGPQAMLGPAMSEGLLRGLSHSDGR